MAIFASTTTSGYSDPIKALSIRALEQRQKDLLAAQAQSQASEPPIQTIPGGIGHVLGIVGDKMQQGRNEQALAGNRDALSKIISGYDPASGAPPPAGIAALAPDMYKDMMQVWAENRRAAATDATQRYTSDQTSGATRYSADQSSGATRYSADQTSGATRYSADQTAGASKYSTDKTADTAKAGQGVTTAGNQLHADVEREKITSAEKIATAAATAKAAETAADPVKEAKRLELQRNLTQKQLMADKLERAGEAFNHPGGIYQGSLGRMQALGSATTGIGDKEKAQRTLLFDDAMNEVATGKMADVLTGPTTNFELTKFREMGNNPNVGIDERRTQFNKVLAAMRKDRDATAASVKKVGGDPADPTAPAAPAAAAAPTVADPAAAALAEAQGAINEGAPFDAVAEILQKKGGDPSKLKPKAGP